MQGKTRLAVILTIALRVAYAQENITYASVSGHVTDPAGAVVRSAQVNGRSIGTNRAYEMVTDEQGRFRFSYLPVGSFELSVQHPGFAESVRTVTLTIGAAFDVPVTLAVASAQSNVTVTNQAPVLEAARSQIAGTILPEEVQTLPLNGRNFLDLALLIPGVSPTNTASTQLFAETSAVPGQGISVSSQRNFSNSFIVDGISANDDAAGLTGTFYSLGVVSEFQVVTSGGQAEFGRALGGYINMVTRSGTNQIHGEAYGFFRNQRLNAANALTGTVVPQTQAQYGASLGGPILRDRTFYFANLERRDLNQEGVITITPANLLAISAQLSATGYRGAGLVTGLYPNPVHNTNFLGKVDHEVSARDQLTARYSLYHVESANSRGVGGLSSVSAAAGLGNTDQTIALSNVATLSANTVNETRGQFTNSVLNALPNDSTGPAVSISGVATFGTLSGSPTGRRNRLVEVTNSLTQQRGAHSFKAGGSFLYNDLTITFPQSLRGSYAFSSLANFQKGIYNNSGYTQSFGNPVVSQTNPNAGFYAQDEWHATNRLTLNLGIRYDLQFLHTIATQTGNVSPRGGFAFTPFASRTMVVRGSYGLFYDRIPLRPLANALLSAGNTTNLASAALITVSLSPAQTGAPVFPATLSALPSGVLVNFSTMDRHIRNPYSEQGSLEIEQQIGQHGALRASYQHLRGLHLIVSVNENTPTCVAAGTNNGCRPDPAFGNNKQYSSLADSHYDGLQLSYTHQPVKWGSVRVSYTYSKALDNVGEFFFSSPIDNFNIWRDYGRSDDDQRHRVVTDATARLPFHFQMSGILQYYSALPLNIVTGSTTVQGTSARPLLPDGSLLSRNAGRGFDSFNINTRLSRTFTFGERFRLEAMAEAFNALNHRNDLIPNGTFGSGAYPASPAANFRLPAAVANARSVQLALRIRF